MDYPDNHCCHPHQWPSDLIGAADVTADSETLPEYECFIGVSAHIAALKRFVRLQAAQSGPVLLIGERGLRQEQISRSLHLCGARRGQPFATVSADELRPEELRRLLFGPVEADSPGTIYLDEFTEMPSPLQCVFAVHLQKQQWSSDSGATASPRLIIATAGDPAAGRAEDSLLESLIESLRPSSFRLQPLRERCEDIPYLVKHLADRIAQRLIRGPCLIEPEAMRILAQYGWEGNIVELEATLESIVAHLPPHRIGATMLPARLCKAAITFIPEEGICLPQAVADYEKSLIENALRMAGGKQNKAAKMLGLRTSTLNTKLKRLAGNGRQV